VQKNGEIDKLEVLKFKNNPSIFPDLEWVNLILLGEYTYCSKRLGPGTIQL
jgi:hypothetical protein